MKSSTDVIAAALGDALSPRPLSYTAADLAKTVETALDFYGFAIVPVEMMDPLPIDTAPGADGWILGDISVSDVHPTSPWIICTRCDGGWCDEGGYGVEPSRWMALPDPQPKPTGWRRATGEVVAECGWLGEEREPIWLVNVMKPDGTYDDAREPLICHSPATATERASEWARTLALPWREGQMDHNAGKVVPFPVHPGQGK